MPATLTKRPKVSERHIQDACTKLLELDSWRAIRTDPASNRAMGKGFGEIGMPDYLYIRYAIPGSIMAAICRESAIVKSEVLWIEYKAPGKLLKGHQFAWHCKERERGALVKMVDDFDRFRNWYVEESGLNRRLR